MNRVPSFAFRLAVAAILLCSGGSRLRAKTPAPAPPAQQADKEDEDKNPFAPQPPQPLPPGMTGSDVNDPRFKLTPGLYDAGEASMGLKHLLLLKKPDAFQLAATDADDPKVQKTIGQLGINTSTYHKPIQLVSPHIPLDTPA